MKFIRRAKAEQQRKGDPLFKIKEKEILKFGNKYFRVLEKGGYETWNGRQIRNAFQTAIALPEHQSMLMTPGDPMPTLGKEQFETVARGFTQFDEYLNKTLGGTDADVARREGYRNDNFMNAGNPPAPVVPSFPAYSRPNAPQGVVDINSDDDDESDSDTESDKDSDDELGQTKGGKSGASGQEMAATSGSTIDDMDEFREYMMWKQTRSQFK